MYNFLLTTHSWLRWAVLIFGVIALIAAIRKHARKDLAADRSSLGLLISADLQLLIGLILFFVSPYFSLLTQAPGAVMGDATTRFFAVEHGLGMIVAIVLVHVGRVVGKRSTSPNRYRTVAIVFAIALLLFLAAIPWPFLSHARPLARW
jgi:uncharacterized membrane-anchored protein